MDVRKIETIKDGDKSVGSRHRVKVVKNKVAVPFRVAEFEVLMNGISREGGILDVGVEMGIIQKSGAFLRYEGEMLGQGRVAAIETLKDNLETQKKIVAQIMKQSATRTPIAVGVEDAEEVTAEESLV